MATDLFGQYFNNPTKSYLYTQMTCNGPSADEISFDIVDGKGVISNNENELSTVDLSDVHVGLTQYTNDMKIIDPYGLIYIKGVDRGSSYTTKAYGKVLGSIMEKEDWMYNISLVFHFKYVNALGNKVVKCIIAKGSYDDDITIVEACQKIFDDAKIPVNVEYKDGYFYFTSTVLGYDFWVSLIELWYAVDLPGPKNDEESSLTDDTSNQLGFGYDDEWVESKLGTDKSEGPIPTGNAYEDILSETDYKELYDYMLGKNKKPEDVDVERIYLFEDLSKYIPAQKYRNGAMKGCVVKASYPVYNAQNITEPMKSLKIAHLVDRVEDFVASNQNEFKGVPVCIKIVRDVVDSYFSQYEFDLYNKWSMTYDYIDYNDNWLNPEEIPYLGEFHSDWDHSHVPVYYMMNTFYKKASKYDAIGLYGYANYLTKRNLWMNMGQLYARTTVEDDESSNTRNLIPSFIIYNPNNFPVTVNYMTFI